MTLSHFFVPLAGLRSVYQSFYHLSVHVYWFAYDVVLDEDGTFHTLLNLKKFLRLLHVDQSEFVCDYGFAALYDLWFVDILRPITIILRDVLLALINLNINLLFFLILHTRDHKPPLKLQLFKFLLGLLHLLLCQHLCHCVLFLLQSRVNHPLRLHLPCYVSGIPFLALSTSITSRWNLLLIANLIK